MSNDDWNCIEDWTVVGSHATSDDWSLLTSNEDDESLIYIPSEVVKPRRATANPPSNTTPSSSVSFKETSEDEDPVEAYFIHFRIEHVAAREHESILWCGVPIGRGTMDRNILTSATMRSLKFAIDLGMTRDKARKPQWVMFARTLDGNNFVSCQDEKMEDS